MAAAAIHARPPLSLLRPYPATHPPPHKTSLTPAAVVTPFSFDPLLLPPRLFEAVLPPENDARQEETAMERVLNAAMDLVVPPASMVMLAFAWPTLSFLRGVEWVVGTLTMEDMHDKVVLITGASSAIGEQVAYEYARRGANLVLVARREHRLFAVRENARVLGAGQVLVIAADVVKEDDCRRLVDDTISYFGQLDHLVNTVSLGHDFLFEEAGGGDAAAFPHLMDINFWGNVYPTHAALPHLRRSHGRVVVNASVDTWLPMPRMSLYSAAKAAVVDFYETLRYEVKDEVGVTVATHGWIGGGAETATSTGGTAVRSSMVEEGVAVAEATTNWKGGDIRDQRQREAPGRRQVEAYARAVVDGACRGDARVRGGGTSWHDVFLVFRAFAPDVLAWTFRLLLSTAAAPAPAGPAAVGAPPPPAALPAPLTRPLLEYPAVAARRAPLDKLE